MKITSKKWIIGYFIVVIGALGMIGRWVIEVDPFFHFHQPDTETYFYYLNSQRNQNDGIIKNFNYDALITGTSMTENFRTSEMDSLFGVNSIKVPFSGASYKEINDNLANALACNPDLKLIIRGLDMSMFFQEKDHMRVELGEYPTYLYDKNIFNDVEYVFNRDVFFSRVYIMLLAADRDAAVTGMTSFDDYSNWMHGYTFGINTVCAGGVNEQSADVPVHLTEEEKKTLHEHIYQNVTSLAEQYPDVDFYYFFPPYSIVWWQSHVSSGTVYKQIEAEKYVIEQILAYENIKLFSFNNRTDITTDLNNYHDAIHYGMWINSLMLEWMHNGQYVLTKENYEDYIWKELSFYTSYDYSLLQRQEDYENDYLAGALLNRELSGVEPLEISVDLLEQYELKNAKVVENLYENMPGIECNGTIQREVRSDVSIADYLINFEYVGGKIFIKDIDKYRYLVFYGKKNAGNGQPSVYIYDKDKKVVAELLSGYYEIDNEWHQYLIDITKVTGDVIIIFNGGYVDCSGSPESSFTFCNMVLY